MSDLFIAALKSGIPLISVESPDILYAKRIVDHYCKTPPKECPEGARTVSALFDSPGTSCYYLKGKAGLDWGQIRKAAQEKGFQVIALNPPDDAAPYVFRVGQLAVPLEIFDKVVSKYVKASKDRPAASQALVGLQLRDAFEILALTKSKFGAGMTAEDILSLRRMLPTNVTGLAPVSCDLSKTYYKPNKALVDWLELEGELFTVGEWFVPRGLLFSGHPGTGKTLGAKFLAKELGVPLYRIDIAGILDKYVGESEKNLLNLLNLADSYSPCVLLMDEVDKLFSSEDDGSGTTSRTYALLLWWLQERQSKILVVMTTNHKANLPAEFYRPGRIDKEIEFSSKLAPGTTEYVEFYEGLVQWWESALDIGKLPASPPTHASGPQTEAEVVESFILQVKQHFLSYHRMIKAAQDD